MQIRRATEADAEQLQQLWEAFTAEATFTPYPGTPFDPAMIAKHVALVAESDGEMVGTVYANMEGPDFGFVFGVYVRPAARRRGIASALMRAIATFLRDEGRAYIVLSVDTPNEAARALYERMGFVDAARMLRADVERLIGG
jgi:ribosomal protein S18 acetylase RimI-like enzyme